MIPKSRTYLLDNEKLKEDGVEDRETTADSREESRFEFDSRDITG